MACGLQNDVGTQFTVVQHRKQLPMNVDGRLENAFFIHDRGRHLQGYVLIARQKKRAGHHQY